MIACSPIHPKIRAKLQEKMRVLGRSSTPANTEKPLKELKNSSVFTKSTFIRMISHVEAPNIPVILMGGELRDETDVNLTTTPMAPQFRFAETYGETFQSYWSSVDDTLKSQTLNKHKRPLPGIKSLEVSYEGGMVTHRKATVSWTCWSFDDLERLKTHFLKHGRHLLIEWGWSNDLRTMQTAIMVDSSGVYRINQEAIDKNLKETIVNNEGDYDLMTGVITNFEWSTRDDGGFDCTTDVVGLGISMLESATSSDDTKLPAYKIFPRGFWSKLGDVLEGGVLGGGVEEWSKKINELTLDINVDEIYKTNASLTLGAIVNLLPDKLNQLHKSKIKIDSPEITHERLSGVAEMSIWRNTALISFSAAGITGVREAWVTWGWFEDNVLNKFTSLVNDSEAVVTFRSIEPKVTNDGEFIKDDEGNLEYESVKIRSHEMLNTVDAKKFILPGLYPNSFVDIKINSNQFKMLSTMISNSIIKKGPNGEEIKLSSAGKYYYKQKDTGKAVVLPNFKSVSLEPFNVPGKALGFDQKGYLRNVLINVRVLQDIFGAGQPISLRDGMQQLADELNSDYQIWDFQVVVDGENQENAKVVDHNFTFKRVDTIIDNPEENLFVFPTWKHNSFVKGVEMSSTVPNSMALSTMYGANVPVESVLGGSDSKASRQGFSLGTLNQDGVLDEKFKNLEKPFRKGVSDSSWKRFGNSLADVNEPLSKDGGINLSLNNEEMKKGLSDSLKRLLVNDPDEGKIIREELKKYKEEAAAKDPEDFQPLSMNSWKYHLDNTVEGKTIGEEMYIDNMMRRSYKELHDNILQGITGTHNTSDVLIPIELTLSIEGVGGIFPGNVFQTAHIPKDYVNKTVFQAVEVNHSIDSSGWTVSLKGIMRLSYIKKYGKKYENWLIAMRLAETKAQQVQIAKPDIDKKRAYDSAEEDFEEGGTPHNVDRSKLPLQPQGDIKLDEGLNQKSKSQFIKDWKKMHPKVLNW